MVRKWSKNEIPKITSRFWAFCLAVAMLVTALPYDVWQVRAENPVSGEVQDAEPAAAQVRSTYVKEEGETFTHPGLLHTQESIEAMKKNVADEVQPSLNTYNQLLGDGFSWDGWRGRPLEHVVRGGSGDNRAQMYIDIERAYQLALLWNLTGEEKYGYAAVYILNVWADTMKSLSGNADRFLAAGIYGYEFANVAELVRDRKDFHKEAFDKLMLNVFYPMNHDFLTNHNGTNRGERIQNYWANWDLCNIASMMAIGIYTDRVDIYNEAVSYYMNGEGNGSLLNAMPYVYGNGLAQWQEAGRDQGHTTLGISLCGSINEMAWSQGMDFYGLADNRLLKAAEYIAKYNNWDDDVPFSTYTHFNSATGHPETNTGVSGASRGHRRPCYTVIYNHYVNRKGMEAPELKKVLYPDGADPVMEGGTRQGDEFGWQSLTFHNVSTRVKDEEVPKVDGAISDGVYRFINRSSGKCLVDRNGSLQSAVKGSMEEEWWKVKCYGDGTCTISNVKTKKVITLNGTDYTSNSPVYQLVTQFILSDQETGEMNQQLYFMKRSDDFCYRIASAASSYIMALEGGNTADDAKVIQYQYSQGLDQDWLVEMKESNCEIAYFNFDDQTEGLKGAGAIADANGQISIKEDKERGNVLNLSGNTSLTVMKEDKTSLLAEHQAVTISYYSKTEGTSGGTVIYGAPAEGASSLEITENGGKVSVSKVLDGKTYTAEGNTESGWNHIVLVLTNGEIRLYINGSLASDVKGTGTLGDLLGNESSLQIGKSGGGTGFTGLLDDCAVYNYAMNASQVAAMEGRRMLADFTFDDTVDGFISDNARAVNAGKMVLSDDIKQGQTGKSLQLDGTGSNYLNVVNKNHQSLVSGLSELTISYWSKVTQDGACWASYLSPNDNIQAYENELLIGIMENSGTLYAERYKNSGKRLASISAPVQKNEWKHVAVTYTKDATVLYINGKRTGYLKSRHTLEEILGDNGIFYIGRANWGKGSEYFNGWLDNFHIYNFALSDAQIEKDYQGYQAVHIPADEEDHSKDKQAAQKVMDQINGIGTVEYTEACCQKIESARSAYDALTETQKVWVVNIDALTRAEKQYRELTPIEPKTLAYFTFDNETDGFAYENAVAQKEGEVILSDKAVHGKALRLGKDGGQSYLKLLDKEGNSLLKYCKEITVSYWGKVYSKASNWGFYAAKDDAVQNFNFDRYLAVNDAGSRISAERYYNVSERPEQLAADSSWSEWRYITAVYGKNKTVLYVDGVKAGEQESSDTVSTIIGEDPVAYIGKANWGSGEYYSGLIDEMKIYNYARSAEEVKADYQQYSKPETVKECIASFSFDNETEGFQSQGTAKAVSKGQNQLVEGISGNALSLDGTGDNYLTLEDAEGNSLLDEEEELTVSFWSQTLNEGTNWAFFASGDKEAQEFRHEKFVSIFDGGYDLTAERYLNTGERLPQAQASVTKNDWKHVAVVYGKNATTIYVDGKEAGSMEAVYALPQILGKSGVVHIGRANWGSGEYYHGVIDEVSIYNYAFTHEEISELSQKHKVPSTEKKKLASFTFDDTDSGFLSQGAKAQSAQAPSLSEDAAAGKALELKDGNYLTVTDASGKSLLTGCKELTASYWGKADDMDHSNWILYAAPNDNAQIFNYENIISISDQGSSVIAERFQNSGARPTEKQMAEASANEWRHVAVVYGRRTTAIYINGENVFQADSKVLLEDVLGENSVLYIGKANWGAGEYGNACVDEMSIYNYALSEDEIKSDYQLSKKTQEEIDREAADEIIRLIGAVGKVELTEECKTKIDDARAGYDKLSEAQKALVENYDVLVAAEKDYVQKEMEAGKHTHVFKAEWKTDVEKHWHECICGERQDEAVHEKNQGVVTKEPTALEPGEMTYSCKACGYVMEIKKIEASGGGNEPENPDNPQNPDDSQNPDDPQNPDEPQNPDNPQNPDDPQNPQNPEEAEAQKNKAAAETVHKLIAEIGAVTVSDDCWSRILAARNAYDALNDVQKKLVTNCDILFQAENNYKNQKEQIEMENEGTQSQEEAEKSILNANTDRGDVPGSSFAKMKLKGIGAQKSVKLSWSKPRGTAGYLLYGAACGKKLKFIKNLPASKKSYTVKRLAKGKYYRYVLAAYKVVNGEKRIIGKTATIHVCTNGGKNGNPTAVVYHKKKITLKRGKSYTLKPSYKSKAKVSIHGMKFRFESSNNKIAAVTKKGKVKGVKKGSCKIYMYTQNGLCKTVQIKVK